MPATQPISLTSESAAGGPDADAARADLSLVPKSEPSPAIRRHLPNERRALTHHFSIAGQEGYLTVGV
jgi:ribonucleoside-diphosphate reductase alpha chain